MPNWTDEQKLAIYEKDSNILVAAAAGSGKTAVLVERIINKAIKQNIDIDRLLVVTFTNAAASEMRERVLNAIHEKLDADPENENLQRQITLLNLSSICTIDSFCLEIVKNNFYELENVSPGFRIADTPEIELLKQEILEDLFEKKYISKDQDFINLINTYTSYRDDSPLKDLILNIYNYISSSPFPKKWLNEKVEMFNIENKLNNDFGSTVWGNILLKEISEEIEDDLSILNNIYEDLKYDKDLVDFMLVIENDIKQIKTLKENLNSWDKSFEIAKKINFLPWPRKKVESETKEEAKMIRDNVKKKFSAKRDKIFVSDSKQSNQDIFDMYQILKKLEKLILEFDNNFFIKKREKNIVDFTDIEHFALDILVKGVETYTDENGIKREKIIKSEVAKKYTEKFEEIAIDEYQDSNLVQEFILSSVSRGNNMFMVGDVKQSIYRFRQAMPKLFIDKYENFETVVPGKSFGDIPGRKIQLFKNFRSRDNVLDFTNLIFKDIMSHELGEVEYDEKEYLNFGAKDYKDTVQDLRTEIDIIDVKKDEADEESGELNLVGATEEDSEELEHIQNIEIEAKHVAKRIKKLMDDKYQVYDRKSGTFRDIRYKDIAILLRSTKNKANVFEQELINLGMAVFADSNQEYLNSIEIQTIMCILKIIDNPYQDIPLVSILRSNIWKFTDNELVEIRLFDKKGNFYNCMQKALETESIELKEKIQNFINQIDTWRKEQEYLSLDELIWKIYQDTGYYNFVGLMPNGTLRQANLKMLFERAKKYESASFKGLYNFINFIEKLKNNAGDLSAAKIIGENDDVIRIMSIHKSKGLEFPVVFVSNSDKLFNEQDIKKNPILLHQDIGIGARFIDYNLKMQYDTLTREASKNVIRTESVSEEMRILYVALTRAKEKLIITGISKDFVKQVEAMEKQVLIYPKQQGKLNPILVKKYRSYLDWILLVYLYEKHNSENLLQLHHIDKNSVIEQNVTSVFENTYGKIINKLNSENINEEQLNKVLEIINFEYKNKLAIDLPKVISVTKIKEMKLKNEKNDTEKEEMDNQKIIFEKPEFIKENIEEQISSARKGTLVHLCMQNLNPKIDYNIEKIDNMILEFVNNGIITEAEAKSIDRKKILQFTNSKIWQDLKEAKEYYQEKSFYINISAKEVYNEETDDNMLVQGIIDLFYIDKNDKLVLLDYKTDYVKNGNEIELIEKYKSQLELYKEALEKSLDKKVDKIYIYSVCLGKEIEI